MHVGCEFATVKIGLQIGEGDSFVRPEHGAADLRDVEFPVVERPAGQLKTEVRVFSTPHLHPAVHTGSGRLLERVGTQDLFRARPNGVSDEPRIHRAEGVSKVNCPRG